MKALHTRARSLVWLTLSGEREPAAVIRILFYHRISSDHDELAVTPARFREQMDFLAASGYEVVDVESVAERLASGEPSDRVVGLSFDDGYRDVAENALPVLEGHGFRATVFVAIGAISGSSTFEWYAQPPPLLSWDEIVDLDRGGAIRFGAHTLTHPNLLTLTDDDVRREIVESGRVLETHLGRGVGAFSYPAGLFGARERDLVEEAGFKVAVSCEPGANTASTDRLALRRNQIDARDTLLDFRAKLGGGHDAPSFLRAVHRRVRYGMRTPSSPGTR